MGRPDKEREVEHPPIWKHYKPDGVEPKGVIYFQLDEYEAIRLSDYLGLSHEDSAKRMGISRSTFTRLIGSAHRKIGEAITTGKELIVRGGNIHFRRDIIHCNSCGRDFDYRFGVAPPENCPSCGENNVSSIGSFFNHGRKRRRKGRRRFDAEQQE